MPHRKLVQIGKAAEPAALPTVSQYFADLAKRQAEDIRLLKERAQELSDARAARRAKLKSVREESWRLHPVIPSAIEKRTSRKRATKKNASKRTSKPRPTAKRTSPKRRAKSRSR